MKEQKIKFLSILLFAFVLTACKNTENNKNQEQNTKTPIIVDSTIEDIKIQLDESYNDFYKEDPFSMLLDLTKEVYPKVNKELYNYLFAKISDKQVEVNISDFALTKDVIMDTVDSLYIEVGFQLFYVDRIKVSNDFKTVNISYQEYTKEVIKEYEDTFIRYMNHILNNIAPANLTPTKRFFAIYEYITKHGSYSNNMETTFGASSILVNKTGNSGGYSILAYYVLNHLGIPTDYLSNEAHAWNMVTLNGNKYHTDFTWGAAYNESSYLANALMNDKVRMAGLMASGFGVLPIIKGFYLGNPTQPDKSVDTRYDFLEEVYENYTLDFNHDWIYYSNSNGLYRVGFEGNNLETLLDSFVYLFKEYQGNIYYRNESDGFLYQLKPMEQAVLVDDELKIDYIKLQYQKLIYGSNQGNIEKVIDLNSFKLDNVNLESIHYFDEVEVGNQQTFEVSIKFRNEMNDKDINESIGLIDKEGNVLPTYMFFDEEKKNLTIRIKEIPEKEDVLTLYLLSSLKDKENNPLKENYGIVINIIQEN